VYSRGWESFACNPERRIKMIDGRVVHLTPPANNHQEKCFTMSFPETDVKQKRELRNHSDQKKYM